MDLSAEVSRLMAILGTALLSPRVYWSATFCFDLINTF